MYSCISNSLNIIFNGVHRSNLENNRSLWNILKHCYSEEGRQFAIMGATRTLKQSSDQTYWTSCATPDRCELN
jgi:hypothetical protein